MIAFVAIVLAALALVPSGAHLAALPNKIGLPQAEYFTVQAIYRGWAILGLLWLAAALSNGALAFATRSQPRAAALAIAAALCPAMLAVFLLWTLPANQATANGTRVPPNWEALTRQWEYSHAANAAIVLAGLAFSTASALSWCPTSPARDDG